MKLTDFMCITELARRTGRTRPTLYKYVKDYEEERFDDIPYSFLKLMQLAEEPDTSRRDLIEYCEKHYSKGDERTPELRELIELITANADKLDLPRIKKIIETEIKK